MDFSLNFGARNKTERIPLGDALRIYWKYLVPLTVLPTVIISALGFIQEPWAFWVILPFFYGCGFYAGVPYTRKNAPYSFWAIACVLWMLGAIPGILIFAALKAIFER